MDISKLDPNLRVKAKMILDRLEQNTYSSQHGFVKAETKSIRLGEANKSSTSIEIDWELFSKSIPDDHSIQAILKILEQFDSRTKNEFLSLLYISTGKPVEMNIAKYQEEFVQCCKAMKININS